MKTEALRMERVTYKQQDITLLDNFNFHVFSGEIMGLIPFDSRGIEALLLLLQENRPIYYGYIYLNEKLVNSFLADMHSENNVALISNESNLVNYLSAAENVFVLRRGYKGFFIRKTIFRQQLQRILDELNISIPTDRSPADMSLFERYVLGLIKSVISRPDIIILQDPSSVLDTDDILKLRKIIRFYANQGQTFVYISVHRDDLEAVCDRISLMANGQIVKVVEKEGLTDSLLSYYAAPGIGEKNINFVEDVNYEGVVFRCNNLYYRNIKGLSFSVGRGECLIIQDYGNQIYQDLTDILTDARPDYGKIFWPVLDKGRRRKRSVGIILENPAVSMIYKDMSYEENLCITIDHKLPDLWRRAKARKTIVKEIIGEERYDEHLLVKDLPIKEKYRLVYNRILLQRPEVVFCIHPYLNLDMELQDYVEDLLKNFLKNGIAVVIVTVNFRSALKLADRLILIREGKLQARLERKDFEYLIP